MTDANFTPETETANRSHPVNSIGWLATQLNLEVAEAIALVRQAHRALPLAADASTLIPPDKVSRLLATKQGRDNILGAAPVAASPTQAPQPGGAIATERRLLNLHEIKTVAAAAGVTQKLAKSIDSACFEREQKLHALRGYRREEELIEAENTGRLIARIKHGESINETLDELELELAQNKSKTSDLAFDVFGINLQDVIDGQAETEGDRVEVRTEWAANFAKSQAGERLGEDALIDPWAAAKHSSSTLGAKRFSKLRRGAS